MTNYLHYVRTPVNGYVSVHADKSRARIRRHVDVAPRDVAIWPNQRSGPSYHAEAGQRSSMALYIVCYMYFVYA